MIIQKKSPGLNEKTINDLKNHLINTINTYLQNENCPQLSQFKIKINHLLIKEFEEFIKDFFSKNTNKKQGENTIKSRAVSYNPKKLITIPHSSESDYFTSKDIQNEYKEITRKIQRIAMKKIKDKEVPQNKSLAYFLKDVAYISRKSFYNSIQIYDDMQKAYLKSKGKKPYMRNNLQDFSIWIKHQEKYNKNLYIEYFNEIIDFYSKDEKEYFKELYNKLLILFFHCKLSFPPININFKIQEDEFNDETMLDPFNYGKGKLHFVYLPSLCSNGNYLDNAKLWVYSFSKNEFHFSDKIINDLNKNIK